MVGRLLLLIALGLAAVPAHARPSEPAGLRAFIERVYAGYPRRTPWPEEEFKSLFAPELRELLRRNDAYSPDEVGPLDGDPICQCQEDLGFSHKLVRVSGAGNRGTVVVRNIFGPPAPHREELLTYRLVRIAGRWHIDDIATKDQQSMKAWLRTELAKPH